MATEATPAHAPAVVSLADVEAAAARIKGVAIRTPLLECAELNEACGGRILIKPECLQRTGSFKFRGAYNRLSQLDDAARQAGVVAWSSGNHAQGVAAAAKLLGIRAAIVMPYDAPQVKLEKTRAYGAEIIGYDRKTENREEIGMRLASERRAVLVPSYDDPHIIAGQGTAGLELCEQCRAIGCELDALLVCCGGGGLIAGMAMAVKALTPKTNVYAVEPDGFDGLAQSLRSGNRERVAADAASICDALLIPQPGEITFSINSKLLSGGLVVTDGEVKQAMRFAFSTLKLVVEPGGAVALAAVLTGKIETAGKTTAIVLSGGNVDPALYAEILNEHS